MKPQYQRFVQECRRRASGAKAYQKVYGCSPRAAANGASRLLQREEIQAALAESDPLDLFDAGSGAFDLVAADKQALGACLTIASDAATSAKERLLALDVYSKLRKALPTPDEDERTIPEDLSAFIASLDEDPK
jgi:phage FluMu gp28-like protein